MEQPTKTDIWMPLYWGDLLADTLHLNRADFGSYILLIGAYWRNGGPIADDDEALCTATRCLRQDWSRTKGILSAFFTVSNGKWTHKRIEIELAAARKRKQDIIDNSRKGVEARRALGQLPKEPKVHPKVEPKDEPEGNQRRTYSPSPSPSSVQAQSPSQSQSHSESRRFAPPSLEEVKLNGAKIGLPDSECVNFHAYYESNGWRVGRNPMKSWNGAMIHWRSNWKARNNGNSTQTYRGSPEVNPRNAGCCPSKTDYGDAVRRKQTAQMAGQVVKNQSDQSSASAA